MVIRLFSSGGAGCTISGSLRLQLVYGKKSIEPGVHMIVPHWQQYIMVVNGAVPDGSST